MMTLDFDYFFKQLKSGTNINETCFYFADDPKEEERYLGYDAENKPSYWAGYCDVKDGAEFETADELVSAPIFNGKSLKERWKNVRICGIEGFSLEDWIECMEHV